MGNAASTVRFLAWPIHRINVDRSHFLNKEGLDKRHDVRSRHMARVATARVVDQLPRQNGAISNHASRHRRRDRSV